MTDQGGCSNKTTAPTSTPATTKAPDPAAFITNGATRQLGRRLQILPIKNEGQRRKYRGGLSSTTQASCITPKLSSPGNGNSFQMLEKHQGKRFFDLGASIELRNSVTQVTELLLVKSSPMIWKATGHENWFQSQKGTNALSSSLQGEPRCARIALEQGPHTNRRKGTSAYVNSCKPQIELRSDEVRPAIGWRWKVKIADMNTEMALLVSDVLSNTELHCCGSIWHHSPAMDYNQTTTKTTTDRERAEDYNTRRLHSFKKGMGQICKWDPQRSFPHLQNPDQKIGCVISNFTLPFMLN